MINNEIAQSSAEMERMPPPPPVTNNPDLHVDATGMPTREETDEPESEQFDHNGVPHAKAGIVSDNQIREALSRLEPIESTTQ
jgi:hypothetical protein